MKKKYLLSILVIVIASLLYVQSETEDKTEQLKKYQVYLSRNGSYKGCLPMLFLNKSI